MTLACRGWSDALETAATKNISDVDFLHSLERLSASSISTKEDLGLIDKVVTVAKTLQGLLRQGRGWATTHEALAVATNAYCALLRQVNAFEVKYTGADQVTAVLQPLQTLCELPPIQECSGTVFTMALATCVDVASHNTGSLTPETLASLVEAATARLPTAQLQFDTMEVTAAAAAALACLCKAFGASMTLPHAQRCFVSVAQSLHALAMSRPPADEWHIKAISNLVATLTTLVPLPSIHIRDTSAILLDAFTMLWTFGVADAVPRKVKAGRPNAAAVPTPASAPGSPASGKYIPPWRRTSRCSSEAANTSPYSSDASASSRRDTDPGTRVRMASMQLLTLCLRQFPTSLHPVWDRLLPNSDATLPSARPRSLMGVLLHDPSPTVRTAAAVALQTMLTGPRNAAFVRVARSTNVGLQRSARLKPARAFMPLSESLALMVQAMHTALAAALQRESVQEVALEALKAADLLMQHAPYQNLPAEPAQELVTACIACWNNADSRPDAQGSHSGSLASPRSPRQDGMPKRCAALSLLATAARSSAALPLTNLTVVNPTERTPTQRVELVTMLMACVAPGAAHPALQWEACGVLRALCQHRPADVPLRWPEVQALVRAHVDWAAQAGVAPSTPQRRGARSSGQAASMPEKVANQAVRLAGDFASASWTLTCEADTHDRGRGCTALALDFTEAMAACAECAGAPAVQSAAYAALGAAPAALWAALPGDHVERSIAAVQRVVATGSVPVVRGHAVTAAAAALSHAGSFAQSQAAWSGAAMALLQASTDSTASVRVAAAAALARVCAQLRFLVYPEAADPGALDTDLGAGSAQHDGDPPELPGAAHAEQTGSGAVVPVAAVLGQQAWAHLREAVLAAAQGGEKTSVHGLRALGYLASLLPTQDTRVDGAVAHVVQPVFEASHLSEGRVAEAEMRAWGAWLADALPVLRQGLASGSAKNAWNACTAAAQVFARCDRLHGMVAASALQELHAGVVSALRQSQNFKVRIHAARALHAAGASVCRDGVGGTLPPVIAVLRAVEAEGGGGGGAAASTSSIPARTAAEGSAAGDAAKVDLDAHFRYHAELRESLCGVLADLLAACTARELQTAAADMEWILEFLDGQVAAWSVISIPDAAPDPEGLEGQQYMTQEATLRGNTEEVAVKRAPLRLVIPPVCASVAAAVFNVDFLVRGGSVALAEDGRGTLSRLKALLSVSASRP
eukprot:jgi/Ulvmu1/1328/UM011_0056.1